MCKITKQELHLIARRLTLHNARPEQRTPWRQRGFNKISQNRLVAYWEKRINSNSSDMALACQLVIEFVRNAQQQAPKVENVVKPQDVKQEIAYPSAAEMAKNLASSMKDWAKKGFKIATNEQVEARLEVCRGCEWFDRDALAGTGRCKRCGCSTQAKLRIATQSCPINLWGPVEETPLTETT
jgi:hypothetical protein